MTFRTGITLLAALLLQGCDTEPSPAAAPVKPTIPAQTVAAPDFSGANCMYHADRLTAIGDRAPASPGAAKQRQYLKTALESYGWAVSEQTFEELTPTNGKVIFTNLRARYGAAPDFNTPAKGLLTCHVDTKTGIPGFVGANDGASGAATLLELARILAKTPARAATIELVFFDGEECFGEHITDTDGLYGSRYHAAHLPATLPEWMINLDMVGRQGKKIRIPSVTPPVLYQAYTKAIADLGLSRTEWGVSAGGILDDHIPYMELDIHTLNIIDDFMDGNWWHTTADSMDILCPQSFDNTGRLVLHILGTLLP